MLEIPQASVFNGKPAQEKAPNTVQRRRKAHAVQSILAAHRDSLRPARMEQEMECSSAYNIFSKKRCPVWEITPPTFIVPVSAS